MTQTPELSVIVRDQLELYRRMWVMRLLDMAIEEARIDGLLTGPVQPAFGQEAVAVGTTAALRPGDIIATDIAHCRHAQRVALGLPLAPTIAELIGTSPTRARRPAAKGFVADWKQSISPAGVLGQSTLFALGDAHSQSRDGKGRVTVCVIGNREAGSVEFTAAADIAVSWRLPVVFVVENTRDASGVRRVEHVRACDGMPVLSADGKEVAAVRDSVQYAVERASAGDGPTLVDAVTYRTNHPCAVDPLVAARRQLTASGVAGGHLYEVERRARRLVAEAESLAKGMSAGGTGPVLEQNPWTAAS
ncbi:dehydrogenase [Mycobacterium saskatchewanense]|uniref:Dehydrogenase n=1 Tax=Mycobacterium saskatchewanense TaxID=220927 RepID=A0AAJ3TV62_9MYCO|nr:thiamine pyrophosphate-dependent enzyme [Mycobacterium saskatchewanense]ORW71713.1 dehydrogenase [Mycobacterium saskatchewanense]BBX63486.1 dehydrogenase [Mycobacterium saskatchewanense]